MALNSKEHWKLACSVLYGLVFPKPKRHAQVPQASPSEVKHLPNQDIRGVNRLLIVSTNHISPAVV